MRTPSDQKSTARSCPLFRMISGATYSGVPQNVQVLLPTAIRFEKPKSTTCDAKDGFVFEFGAKIREEKRKPYLNVALGVEQEVLRLEISVDDAAAVQVVDGVDDAGDVEPVQGCQMAIARYSDCMHLALRASGLWLRYATLQK